MTPTPSITTSHPLVPRPFRVAEATDELADVRTLVLDPPEPFPFRPGQFTMLFAFGAGEVPISISGHPDRPGQLVHTIRRVGLATNALCGLEPGDTIGVRGPFGSHWPIEQARGGDALIVAGGLGLAPVRPILYALLADREAFGRVVLVYGARSPDGLLYRDQLRTWDREEAMEIRLTVDHADPTWTGRVGVVTDLLPELNLDPGRTTTFCCGPEIMMRFVLRDLKALGCPAERIHLSMERNMQCAVGICGHCQWGGTFVCKDGPVYAADTIEPYLNVREL